MLTRDLFAVAIFLVVSFWAYSWSLFYLFLQALFLCRCRRDRSDTMSICLSQVEEDVLIFI